MKIDLAKIVAVVVPSPALSFVLLATCLTNYAPTFMYLSENSIALATVTPSLVIFGEPKLYSITTFLPLGPNVVYTASANKSQPLSIRFLQSILNLMSLPVKKAGEKRVKVFKFFLNQFVVDDNIFLFRYFFIIKILLDLRYLGYILEY